MISKYLLVLKMNAFKLKIILFYQKNVFTFCIHYKSEYIQNASNYIPYFLKRNHIVIFKIIFFLKICKCNSHFSI